MTSTAALTLRPARPADADALERLAALDSTRLPAGPHLVAELDGAIVAAVSEPGARAIADPFQPTAEAVALLHRWAAQRSDRRSARTFAAHARPSRRGTSDLARPQGLGEPLLHDVG